VATATDERAAPVPDRRGWVVRYGRPARWYHAAFYLVTLLLLATGWWIYSGHEGEPRVLARLANRPDTELHRQAGWVLVGLTGVGLTIGARAAWTFVRETLRADRGDLRWFGTWPRGALTGRFAPHRRHFDPGQRIANIAFVITLGALIGSGVALTTLHGGPTFVWLVRVHRIATFALIPLIALHVLLTIGILPGYRGAWRSMHLGGRVPRRTVERLWPASAPARSPREPERTPRSSRDRPPASRR
jgi:cytochrome b subunit of formate dehydrogenase